MTKELRYRECFATIVSTPNGDHTARSVDVQEVGYPDPTSWRLDEPLVSPPEDWYDETNAKGDWMLGEPCPHCGEAELTWERTDFDDHRDNYLVLLVCSECARMLYEAEIEYETK